MAEVLQPALDSQMRRVVEAVAMAEAPSAWIMLPKAVKEELFAKAQADAPKVIKGMMTDLKSRIEDLFDLEELVVSVLMEDPTLINDMFIKCGYLELQFIRDSGAVMGGIFGLFQMGLWFFYQACVSRSRVTCMILLA